MFDDVPRIKPQMRALLECSVQLARRVPIPLALLRSMLSASYADEFPDSITDLVEIGMFQRVTLDRVLVTPAAYEFMSTRTSKDTVRLAVERGTVLYTLQLLDKKDEKGLAAIRDHLWVVTMRTLPRMEKMDEEMQILVHVLMDSLALLNDAYGLRRFGQQLDKLPSASPSQRAKATGEFLISPAMTIILQCAAYLTSDVPFPRKILDGLLSPDTEVQRAIAYLVEDGLLIEEKDSLRMTAQARKLAGKTNLEAKEAVMNAVIDLVSEAIERSNLPLLREIKPHLRAFTEEYLPEGDEIAYLFCTWMTHCLLALQDFSEGVYFAEQAERLRSKLGIEPDTDGISHIEDPGAQEAYLGLQYYAKHDFQKAKDHFENAIRSEPKPDLRAAIYQKLSECYGQLHDIVNQVAACAAALQNAVQFYGMGHPELAHFRADLALLLVEGMQYDEAERQLQEALSDCKNIDETEARLLENKVAVLLLLADLRFKQKRPAEARLIAKDAFATVRNIAGRWTSRTRFMYFIASMCFRNGEMEFARRVSKQAFSSVKQLDLSVGANKELYELIRDLRAHLK